MNFHNTLLRFLFTFAAVWALYGISYAKNDLGQEEADNLAKTLKTAVTSSDSLKILLNVYDLSDKVNKAKIRSQIIGLVKHSSNDDVVIRDVIHEFASFSDDVGELNELIDIADQLQEKESKKRIKTMLQMEQAEKDAKNIGKSELEQQIAEYTRNGMNLTGDPYEEIENIYRALVYLGSSSQGPMYLEYIKRLEELVEALPERDHDLRSLFYTTAALYYTNKRDYRKAIELDQKQIKELDAINAHYEKQGRTRQNLAYFYYLSYRRMLRNFKGLTPEEVEDYYQKAMKLAQEDEKVAETFGNSRYVTSYYYMATKQYAKAIPELKIALQNPNISKYRRREMLGHLALALRETGNQKEELQTMREFTDMLLADRDERMNDMYREIEMRNTVNKIIADETRAQEQQRNENRDMRRTSLTLVYVLAVILIFLMGAYMRLRRRVKELENRNNRLRTNIEHIFDDGVPKGTRDLRYQRHGLKG